MGDAVRVLVGCEFSGIVRDAFRARGHEVISCDYLDSAAPGPHYKGNVLNILDDGWDLMIAHPPCTYLAVSGARWFEGREVQQGMALDFVRDLMRARIPRIAIENPVSIISSHIRKPDQIIQPWQFGHDASKATCLWLKNLWPLVPTEIVNPSYACCGTRFEYTLGKYGCANCNGEKVARPVWGNQTPGGQNKLGPSPTRASDRSRTYPGIAQAMAEQWEMP